MENFIYGTQNRFEDEIVNNGLNRSNSAVFHINDLEFNGDLAFTFVMALYHAISIDVQNEILEKGYKSFSEYYNDNLDKVPSIIHFLEEIDKEELFNGKTYNKVDSEDNINTYPYYKVGIIGNMNNIVKVNKLMIEDILFAEKMTIDDLEEGNDRFFVKGGDFKNKVIQDDKLKKIKLISKEYMLDLCYNLYDILSVR